MPKAKHESAPREGLQVEKFRDLARQLECDEDEKAFEEKVKRVASVKERVRVDFAKVEGFTAWPVAGGSSSYPIFATQQELRDFLAASGLRQVGDNPDLWER